MFFSLALSPLTGNALRAPLANHQLLVPTDKGEGKGKREREKGKGKGRGPVPGPGLPGPRSLAYFPSVGRRCVWEGLMC